MLCEPSWLTRRGISPEVLILVLMEDALRESQISEQVSALFVLILVLMEDALRVCRALFTR